MADAQNIIKIILLLPGEQAARVRTKASEVFVRFLGGDVTGAPPPYPRLTPEYVARLVAEHLTGPTEVPHVSR